MHLEDQYYEAVLTLHEHQEYVRLCNSCGGQDPSHSNYEHTRKVIEITKQKIADLEIEVERLKLKMAQELI
jgi:hypothetical protein